MTAKLLGTPNHYRGCYFLSLRAGNACWEALGVPHSHSFSAARSDAITEVGQTASPMYV